MCPINISKFCSHENIYKEKRRNHENRSYQNRNEFRIVSVQRVKPPAIKFQNYFEVKWMKIIEHCSLESKALIKILMRFFFQLSYPTSHDVSISIRRQKYSEEINRNESFHGSSL